MRKKKFTVLGLAVLSVMALSGCADTSSVAPTNTEPPATNNSSAVHDTGNDNPSSNTSSGGGGSEVDDPSSGVIDVADSPWSQTVTDFMVTYLGGGILPYIQLGEESQVEAQYVKNDENENYRSYLRILGGSFRESYLDDAVDNYREHSWESLMVGEDFYASSDLLDIEVEVYRNNNGLFELKAFYNEPFDPSAATSWNDDTSTLIREHFGRFAIPFVYLGTVNYDAVINADGALQVTGGSDYDSAASQFRSVFRNTDGWEVTSDSQDSSILYATYSDGGNVLTVTLRRVNTKAQMTVSLQEVFDETNQTTWSSEVVAKMNSALNQNVLPYVYLGAVYPTIDTTLSTDRKVVIVGNIWDDSILASAKEAFVADGWTDSSTDTVTSFTKGGEGERFDVTIEKNSDGQPQLTASRTELYNDTLTAYPANIVTAFQDKYGAAITGVVPFVNLGTAYPTINNDVFNNHADTDTMKLVIAGGSYDSRTLTQFEEKFTEDGWYLADDMASDTGSNYGDSYGDVLAVAVKKVEDYTYKVGLFTLGNDEDKTAYLEINRSNNTGNSSKTDWTDETKRNFVTALGDGVEIPYFDTGRDTLEAVLTPLGGLDIQFVADTGTFSYRVFSVIDALKNADWNVTVYHNDTYYDQEAWVNAIRATKDFHGKTVQISVSLSSSTYYRFYISGSISLVESYDPSKVTGSWDQSISDSIREKFNIDLPYIYLGTDKPYVYQDDEEGIFRIVGNALDPRVFTNARVVLEAAGFKIDLTQLRDYYLVATKSNDDGNLVTITIDYESNHPYIDLALEEVFNPGSATAWDADVQAVLDENLAEGVEVPFIYLGTANPTATAETFNDVTKISIVGGDWNNQAVDLAEGTLNSLGWETNVTSNWGDKELTAYQLYDNRTALRIKLNYNYDDKIQLDVYFDRIPENPVEGLASWDSFPEDYGTSINDALSITLNNNEMLEFVPTAIASGADGSVSISSSEINSWSDYHNQYMTFTASNEYITPYYIYMVMDTLEANGFTITSFDPFMEEEMPGFTAEKTDENGTYRLQFKPYNGYFDSAENGWRFTLLYLAPFSEFEDIDSWNEGQSAQISNSLDGLTLPYVNMGCDNVEVNASTGEVEITGYNYSEELFNDIKAAYEADDWTVYETYSNSDGVAKKTLVGYKEVDGHVYILNVTFELTTTTVTTTITIQMVDPAA